MWQNQSAVLEFILLGFGDHPTMQAILFFFFLVIYLVTMVGNTLIVFLVAADEHLHTPMYFFLGNLSFLEICCSCTILPKMLSSLLTGDRSIFVQACLVQLFIFACLGGTECYLLSMMSYDRYLAICRPLHYAILMNGRLSFQLTVVSWVGGFLVSTVFILNISRISFCGPNEIDHYFCDIIHDIKYLSCSDTYVIELTSFISACIFTLPPFLLTISSYGFIIVSVLRIPSTAGREKAFSTCSSHLAVVALYYGSLMLVYLLPRSRSLRYLNKTFSLSYTILTPMLNPLIYSLRNKEVKMAMSKGLSKLRFFMTLQRVCFLKLKGGTSYN